MKCALAAIAALMALAGCGAHAPRLTTLDGVTMGTTYRVKLVSPSNAELARSLHARIDALLRSLDARMSTYVPDSELSRFNACGGIEWFTVSPDTLTVVEEALRISRITGGAFDVTVAPLVELWGFGPQPADRRERPRGTPPSEEVELARARVGSEYLETRASPPSIRARVPGVRIDLSAIAKGFAVDAIAALLERASITDYLVDVGGELRAGGHDVEGRPWSVGIESPTREGANERVLHLADAAVATSGDYRNAFTAGGVVYTHVIDPRSGAPVTTGIASATVVTASAMEADAYATAMMVLSPDEALRLAGREGLAVRLLVRTDDGFVERATPRFPHPARGRSEGRHGDDPR